MYLCSKSMITGRRKVKDWQWMLAARFLVLELETLTKLDSMDSVLELIIACLERVDC